MPGCYHPPLRPPSPPERIARGLRRHRGLFRAPPGFAPPRALHLPTPRPRLFLRTRLHGTPSPARRKPIRPARDFDQPHHESFMPLDTEPPPRIFQQRAGIFRCVSKRSLVTRVKLLPMNRILIPILFFHALVVCAEAGSIVCTFSETPSEVVLSYSGQLDTATLSNQGGLSYSNRYVDIFGAIQPGQQIFEFQNAQPTPFGQHPSYLGTSTRYSAQNITYDLQMGFAQRRYTPTQATGDCFGFYVFDNGSGLNTWINLPYLYVSGQPISGQMRFAGQTLASMGLQPAEYLNLNLPGGQLIRAQVQSPAPEPGTSALLAAGFLCGMARRRKAV